MNIRGTINSWGNPCTIKVEGGSSVQLDISDASIAGGYIPQEGDQVVAAYSKDDMKLLHLQLEYRPAPEPEKAPDPTDMPDAADDADTAEDEE